MKKLLTLALAAVLACTAFTASLADKSGAYEYRLNPDNTATITDADSELKDGNIPAEIIGHKVTAIETNAFFSMRSLTDVVIPEGVKTLGQYTFHACRNLKTVAIPDSLEEIGEGSFSDCDKIPAFRVSPNHPVFAVNNKALINTRDMVLLKYADAKPGDYEVGWGIKRIGVGAFSRSKLKSITLPATVTEIGPTAFADCSNLQEITLPETLTSIGHQAFIHCHRLKSVTIPDSVTSIDVGVFGWCENMKTVQISPEHPVFEMNGPLLINKQAKKVINCLSSVKGKCEIPDGIEMIDSMAFAGCWNLKELTIPESVKVISTDAFLECKKLVIKAPAGSYAQKFCGWNGIKFEPLSE